MYAVAVTDSGREAHTAEQEKKRALSQKRKAHRPTPCDNCGHPLASHQAQEPVVGGHDEIHAPHLVPKQSSSEVNDIEGTSWRILDSSQMGLSGVRSVIFLEGPLDGLGADGFEFPPIPGLRYQN
jgi:hypothetical protein